MKFRKKPIVIEAFRMGVDYIPDWFMDKVTDKSITLRSNMPDNTHFECRDQFRTWCEIKTLEGIMIGNYGDWESAYRCRTGCGVQQKISSDTCHDCGKRIKYVEVE